MRVVRPLLLALSAASVKGAVESSRCLEGQCETPVDEESLLQLHNKPDVKDKALAVNKSEAKPVLHKGLKNSLPYLGGRGDAKPGGIYINEDGKMNLYYLPGAETLDNFTTVKYVPPPRFYLMKVDTTDYSKSENFYKPLLIGKTFSVDIDVSQAGCGCNVNFYMVDMPASSPGVSGDYYCDGQCPSDGRYGCCAEWDMNEGNNQVQQITNHACTGNYVGHPDWVCNPWGDPEVKTTPGDFGTGGSSTIDSNRPFTFLQRYEVTDGNLIVTTTLKQDGRSVTIPMGPSEQLNSMLTAGSLEAGMVLVTGYWYSSSMNWLDGATCGSGPETCSKAPAYISNWKITTNSGPAPGPPAPGPAPGPSGGTCCWESCGGPCQMGDWCSASKSQCESCGGGVWCS